VVYGHSFGAWLGFEVARRLEARGQTVPLLVAGAVRAPHLRSRHAERERLAGPALWQALAKVVGQPPGAEALDEGVRALLEPALRADLAAMAGYTPLPAPLLRAPVLVLAGTADASATADELTAWGRWTTGTCRVRSVPGGHFFIHEAPGLVDLIAENCR
jgi:medium-chain acyl-[acyl-carrier-protein] hydrolase